MIVFEWRQMHSDDILSVYDLSRKIHLDFPEDIAVFENRLSLAPSGCFCLHLCGCIIGYVLSHPYPQDECPDLNTVIKEIPSDSWYIHDVAILPEFRGRGAATFMVSILKRIAIDAGFNQMTLTSVGGADTFWTRQGFVRAEHPTTYGETAIFMKQFI
jgi:ribosomal protein S18 acetylase RimI-like enzyme